MTLNARSKGNRTQLKARDYALSFGPDVQFLPWRQVGFFAQEQPFDVLVLREGYWPRFVEVRSNQWRCGKDSTMRLSQLPGIGYHRQIWMFVDGEMTPKIRSWNGDAWVHQDHPFEGD